MLPDKSKENRIDMTPELPDTIMPTMIDDSEDKVEKKRDLSAIIPKNDIQSSEEDGVVLNSLDYMLKSDGSISIGTINVEGEVTMNPNAKIPDPIDIEERKKQAQRNKGLFKKNKKNKGNKTAQKIQNSTALGALIIIIGLGAFFYWFKNHPTEKDFKVLTVEVELGEALPIRTSEYVKPGVGKEIDEMDYAVDLTNVDKDAAGEYQYTVTYKNITKKGVIKIVDTTKPRLVTKEVIIQEGSKYSASDFVDDCFDLSGCNYSFQDYETAMSHTTEGSYVVWVTATDAFQNVTTKQASLIITSPGEKVRYYKATDYSFKTGYSTEEIYDLVFSKSSNGRSVIIRGTYTVIQTYSKEETFKAAAKDAAAEINVTIDEAGMKIKRVTSSNTVGSNYTDFTDIDNYLKQQKFTRHY